MTHTTPITLRLHNYHTLFTIRSKANIACRSVFHFHSARQNYKIGGRLKNRAVRPLGPTREDDCMHRLPYASLIASLLCILGVALFSIMLSWAFNATAEQTRRTLRLDDWPWLDKVQISFIIIVVLMAIFALFFLCIGITATGGTRDNMYRDEESKCGGKVACAIAMLLDFLLIVVWLFILSIVSMLAVFYYFFDRLCLNLPAYSDADCIDLHVFWPLVASFSNSNLRICGGDVQQFCALTSTAFSWYVIGWVGCILIIVSLLLYFGINASNYAHIGNSNRYVELDHDPYDRSQYSRGDYNERMSSSTRRADARSDTISQFDYRRDKRPKPVY